MKKQFKIALVIGLVLMTVLIMTACGQWDTPYNKLDKEGATVSVRFDAGEGGMFAGTNGVTVVDVFNLSDYSVGANGKIEIPLITPDDDKRGNNAFEVSKSGHALVGWFIEGTDEEWDFGKKLELDPDGDYSSETPVLTLTAKWLKYTTFEFYEMVDGDWAKIGDTNGLYLDLPEWDLNSGKMNYKNFFSKDGSTIAEAYLDEAMTIPMTERVEGITDHTVKAPTVKIYTKWQAGEWFRVSSVAHLTKNASKSGCYILEADLDFTDAQWPVAFVNNEFSGQIIGNGHKISGITTNAAITKGGDVFHGAIFGGLADAAVIRDVAFENITYNVKSIGPKALSVTLGALAGNNAGATLEGVTVSSSSITLSKSFVEASAADIEGGRITIGKLFGDGDTAGIDLAGITVTVEEGAGVTVTTDESGIISLVYND